MIDGGRGGYRGRMRHARAASALASIALVAGALWALDAPPLAADGPADITWREDLAAATKEAAKAGKPLMIVFR